MVQAKQALLPCVYVREVQNKEKESKGAWWMPRLTEAKKDVVSCEKPRVGANGLCDPRISEWDNPAPLGVIMP